MKRFPTPSDIRYQLQRIFVATMLAVAVLALLSEAVHAQPSAPGQSNLETLLSGVEDSADQPHFVCDDELEPDLHCARLGI